MMKTKAAYKRAIQVVGAVIDQWDPYLLLAGGCPADEYDSEIASVVAQIPRIKSEQDAIFVLSHVFTSAFEAEQFTVEHCTSAGSQLYAALLLNGLVS